MKMKNTMAMTALAVGMSAAGSGFSGHSWRPGDLSSPPGDWRPSSQGKAKPATKAKRKQQRAARRKNRK